MNGDFLFLILFLVIFIVGMIIRGYYGRRSPDREKSIRNRLRAAVEHEGRLSFVLLMVQALFMVFSVVLYIFFTTQLFWFQVVLPDWLRWIGVSLGVISLPFLWWVQATLGRAFSPSLTIQAQHTLVTHGPYRYVRHPMYTVHLFYCLSWFLISANILFFITWILMVFYIIVRIPKEEKMLLARFGDEYRQYMNRTGRLVPPLHKKNQISGSKAM
ncbi:MAG: isoprenylcysteine carboxylmethyltransferase family protein [Candidatus Thorarchaeota archaeon]